MNAVLGSMIIAVLVLVSAGYCDEKAEPKQHEMSIFISEVPAGLNEEIDKELKKLSAKYPLTEKNTAQVIDAILELEPRTPAPKAVERRAEQRRIVRETGVGAIPVISPFLLVSRDDIRRNAVSLLETMVVPAPPDRLPVLFSIYARCVHDRDREVRLAGISMLHTIVELRRNSLPAELPEVLVKALEHAELNDPDIGVRREAHNFRLRLGLVDEIDSNLMEEDWSP